jgi:hypothetical protein
MKSESLTGGSVMSKLEVQTPVQRVTLDLSVEAARELDRLQNLTGLTKAELFRHAFNLLRLYIKAAQEGKEFCIIDANGRERVVHLPIVIQSGEGTHDA